jgi:hypothetical protein
MILLPVDNITLKSNLTREEAIVRLSAKVDHVKYFRGFSKNKKTKLYEGKISENCFKIRRIISYRNSYLPRISGTIEKDINDTLINVKMRLHIFILFIQIVWSIGWFTGFIVTLISSINNGRLDTSLPFITICFLLFAYILPLWAFKYESNKSKVDLKNIFEAVVIK